MEFMNCLSAMIKIGDMYKYLIETQDGRKLYKADPYANYAELRPGTASKVADISKLKWSDEKMDGSTCGT